MIQFRNLIARKRPRSAGPAAPDGSAPVTGPAEPAGAAAAPVTEPLPMPEPFVAQSRPVVLPDTAAEGAAAPVSQAAAPGLPDAPPGTGAGAPLPGDEAGCVPNRQELAGVRLRQAGPPAMPAAARANIWDIDPVDGDGDAPAEPPADAAPSRDPRPDPAPEIPAAPVAEVHAEPARRRRAAEPAAASVAARAAPTGRVKTRILGFHAAEVEPAPLDGPRAAPAEAALFPAGWIVVVAGAGRGHAFAVAAGVSTIGRGEDQTIRLDFGDRSISRENHASIAYDEEQNRFFIGHGGKSNIVRRNGHPVLSTEDLDHADLIRIGKTTLRFVALCGPEFTWADATEAQDGDDTDR